MIVRSYLMTRFPFLFALEQGTNGTSQPQEAPLADAKSQTSDSSQFGSQSSARGSILFSYSLLAVLVTSRIT
jgi:hypothetical protein